MGDTALQLDRIAEAKVSDWPFRHLIGEGLIHPAMREVLARDFPDPRASGFFPAEDLTFGPAFASLLEALQSAPFIERVGLALDMDLTAYPQLIVVRRWSARKDGRAHTDGADKVATALVYLNDDWSGEAGSLRYLASEDLAGPGTDPILPRFGAFTAFRRSDSSWHGHPPFEGERRVVQVFWLKDADALARKTRRHANTAFWKQFSRWGKKAAAAS